MVKKTDAIEVENTSHINENSKENKDMMDELNKGYEILSKIRSINETMHCVTGKIFKDINLTPSQAMVVGILMKNGALKVSDISQKIGLSMSTISSILDRMEKAKVIERIKSETDGRIIMIHLTDHFREETSAKFKNIEIEIGQKIIAATDKNSDQIIDALTFLEDVFKNQIASEMTCHHCK